MRNCLADIDRAVKRVKQCSQAALETTVVENLEATGRIEAIVTSSVTQNLEATERIGAIVASGVAQLVSRDTNLDERLVEVLKEVKAGRAEIAWSRQQSAPLMLGELSP